MYQKNSLDLEKAFKILLNWRTIDEKGMERLIAHFYASKEYGSKQKPERGWTIICPDGCYIDNCIGLLGVLLKEFEEEGVEDLIIYLLENDHRLENTDTIENYKTYKPYPSYFIEYAYLLIYRLHRRSRRIFEAFWEHQAKVRPGVYVDCARMYFDLFIAEKITTRDEIKQLLIRDWWRWQEKGYPYYGAAIGIATWYFPLPRWDQTERQLEAEWEKRTGKKPKKWGE